MEEIFGEIEDEHDVAVFTERKISDKQYIFAGRLEIDYLNEKYKLDLPRSEEYETLAGLILYHHEDIPMQNEVIEVESFKLGVIRVEDNVKIELVSLTLEDKDE
jgi:CBS domain containing-hemolysin-like protein